ncbi:MAG: radical SAM protein [Thermodesulfobacteriota bacterium]
MSNLGFQTVYRLLNNNESVVCERAFLPYKEDIDEYIRTSTRLFSLESQRYLGEFDLLAFSISFEEDFLNIPKILKLADIPFFSKERRFHYPFIMAGGVAVSLNPEPIAELMDIFTIGEGEGFIPDFVDVFRGWGAKGAKTKTGLLKELASLEGIYVPGLYHVEYDGHRIKDFISTEGAPEKVKKVMAKNLDLYQTPESFITTPETVFSNTYLLEAERGCGRGCRFCVAGFIYLPPRERDVEGIKESVLRGMGITGKVGLVGAAISEYSGLKEVLKLVARNNGEATLSSLRLDMIDKDLLDLLKKVGYETITIAPEAGSERLRDVINKGIDDKDIINAVSTIRDAGFHRIKLYFLIGLPTERKEDIDAIVDITRRIRGVMRKGVITLSINPFIPKPWTPFQWCSYEKTKKLEEKLSYLKKETIKIKGVKLKAYSPRIGYMQAVLSRGDRRVSEAIVKGFDDSWSTLLRGAINTDYFVYRERAFGDRLPWDFIDHGIKKDYLWKEYQRSLKGERTPPCDVGRCIRCGVCK